MDAENYIKELLEDMKQYHNLLGTKDKRGNVVVGDHTLVQNCTNCLIVNGSKIKALVINDLSDKIVVQTDQCTLTFPQGNDQAIKQIVKSVKIELGENYV